MPVDDIFVFYNDPVIIKHVNGIMILILYDYLSKFWSRFLLF